MRRNAQQAVFGTLDGLASALGLVLAVAAAAHGQLGLTVRALTVGSAVSMTLGEWLSDGGSIRKALVMGSFTALGVASPALPWFFLSGAVAYIASAAIVCALGVMIAELRPDSRKISYAKTFGCIVVAVGLALYAGAGA